MIERGRTVGISTTTGAVSGLILQRQVIVGSWTFPVEQLPAAGPPFDFASPFEAQQERTAGFGAEQQDRAAVGALQQHLPESRRLGEH